MPVEIHGFCDARFLPLRDAFSANFADGLEIGASLAMTHRGRVVADLWAGHIDAGQTRPWERDTIVLVTSTTKIVMSIAAWIVIDRGLLDLDAPVARYWPEFAQGGKGSVTVRDVFTHQAGVPGLDPPVSLATACDWNAMTTRIAGEPHWFGGERRICYHLQRGSAKRGTRKSAHERCTHLLERRPVAARRRGGGRGLRCRCAMARRMKWACSPSASRTPATSARAGSSRGTRRPWASASRGAG